MTTTRRNRLRTIRCLFLQANDSSNCSLDHCQTNRGIRLGFQETHNLETIDKEEPVFVVILVF